MIQASELRIGNWVLMDSVPDWFSTDDFTFKNYEIAQPIPLTPEILEKCGAENNDSEYGGVLFAAGLQFVYGEDGTDVYVNMEYRLATIHYLHQLQNIVHAISGEELNIPTL